MLKSPAKPERAAKKRPTAIDERPLADETDLESLGEALRGGHWAEAAKQAARKRWPANVWSTTRPWTAEGLREGAGPEGFSAWARTALGDAQWLSSIGLRVEEKALHWQSPTPLFEMELEALKIGSHHSVRRAVALISLRSAAIGRHVGCVRKIADSGLIGPRLGRGERQHLLGAWANPTISIWKTDAEVLREWQKASETLDFIANRGWIDLDEAKKLLPRMLREGGQSMCLATGVLAEWVARMEPDAPQWPLWVMALQHKAEKTWTGEPMPTARPGLERVLALRERLSLSRAAEGRETAGSTAGESGADSGNAAAARKIKPRL
jgi:hypothetical protein